MSHKPGGRLPLLSARPAVTLATLKRAATNFAAWWTEAQWVWAEWVLADCYSTASPLRFEPGPFCAWVQHANHSATEPPTGHNKTNPGSDSLANLTVWIRGRGPVLRHCCSFTSVMLVWRHLLPVSLANPRRNWIRWIRESAFGFRIRALNGRFHWIQPESRFGFDKSNTPLDRPTVALPSVLTQTLGLSSNDLHLQPPARFGHDPYTRKD